MSVFSMIIKKTSWKFELWRYGGKSSILWWKLSRDMFKDILEGLVKEINLNFENLIKGLHIDQSKENLDTIQFLKRSSVGIERFLKCLSLIF